jgi:hypothetical protein
MAIRYDCGPREVSIDMILSCCITLLWDSKTPQDTFNSYKTITASYQHLPLNVIIVLIHHQIQELWAKIKALQNKLCDYQMSYDCYLLTKPIGRYQSLTVFLMD